MKKILTFFVVLITIFLNNCAKPNEPVKINKILKISSYYPTIGYARDIDVKDSLLYIAEDQSGFSIYNYLSDSLLCHYTSLIDNAFLISAVKEYNRLFVYDRYGSPPSIKIYDITDISDPLILPSITTETTGIRAMKVYFDGTGYIISFTSNDGGEHKFKIGKYDGFYFTSLISFEQYDYELHGFDIYDNYVYLCNEQIGLNVSDTISGETKNIINTSGVALDVKVVNNYAFVADKEAGFSIIDVQNIESAKVIFSTDTEGYAQSIDVEGKYLAVGSGGGGVYLYDISDVNNPQFLDQISADEIGYTYKVIIKNDIIFAATKRGVYKLLIQY
ncbi:MAG: hypothetical protein DRJ01_18580 [Bacteroidetes bacterium]|nr:MAG: hypothetical protein DRJ01_18580 [Bacteroidota bacterium]